MSRRVRAGVSLVHWTCPHGAAGIRATRTVVPNPATGLSWWTDLVGAGQQTRAALGLTSHILPCDRMRARFVAEAAGGGLIQPWSVHRATQPPALVEGLEAEPGAEPGHWYVATEPVPVRWEWL